MAVNELDRDFLRLTHMCDKMDDIRNGIAVPDESAEEKKRLIGGMVVAVEEEILDTKYVDAGKDMTAINTALTAARTYWKS